MSGSTPGTGYRSPRRRPPPSGAYIDDRGIPARAARSGDEIAPDPANPPVTVLSPPADDDTDQNEASLVLRLVHGTQSVLLTGDAGLTAEAWMLKAGWPLRATVLKVDHHGSSTRTGPAFVSAADPSGAVITIARVVSALPGLTVIDRLQNSGVDVYSTAVSGTARAAVTRSGYSVEAVRGPGTRWSCRVSTPR